MEGEHCQAATWPTLRARLALLGWASWRTDDPVPAFFMGDVHLRLAMVPSIEILERIVDRLEAERSLAVTDFHDFIARRGH